MQTAEALKQLVRTKYDQIARQSKTTNEQSCCGAASCGSTVDYTIMSDDYSGLTGYHQEADLGLGCGLPTEHAFIREGDTVLDLGSGAGNDCFVAHALVGPTGKVIGIDMTEAMIEKARQNARTLGFENVEFRLGDIEAMPVEDASVDVVVSNCVLNLVPDKHKALAETFRVLKSGGHFSVSDIVLSGQLPEGLRSAAEMYAGCVSGAIQQTDYLQLIAACGFEDIQIQKSKAIVLPDEILLQFLSPEELTDFRRSGTGIVSITVFGRKP